MKHSVYGIPVLLSLVTAFGGSALTACSQETSDTTEAGDEQDIVRRSSPDTKNLWSVGVCASTPNTDPARGNIGACIGSGTRCSGSLIAPNLVLTARHCVNKFDTDLPSASCTQNFDGPLNNQGVRITLATSVLDANPEWIEVAEVITPTARAACDNDVALLRLSRNVPAAEATPIELDLTNFAVSPAQLPGRLAMVARGAVAFDLDPKTKAPVNVDLGNLERRHAQGIPMRCYSNDAGACKTPDITSDSGYTTASTGQFIIGKAGGPGDSGAAILSQSSFATGHPVAIGVFSISTFGAGGKPNASIAGRLDGHSLFLIEGVLKASLEGGYAPPAWAHAALSAP